MWRMCSAIFVIPTPLFAALALLKLLIYGGGQDDARGHSSKNRMAVVGPQCEIRDVREHLLSQRRPEMNLGIAEVYQ